MGPIRRELPVWDSKARKGLEALFDSGAPACFVPEDVARGIGPIPKHPLPLSFALGDEETVRSEEMAAPRRQSRRDNPGHTFLVVSRLPHLRIVRADSRQRRRIGLDLAMEELIVGDEALDIFLVQAQAIGGQRRLSWLR